MQKANTGVTGQGRGNDHARSTRTLRKVKLDFPATFDERTTRARIRSGTSKLSNVTQQRLPTRTTWQMLWTVVTIAGSFYEGDISEFEPLTEKRRRVGIVLRETASISFRPSLQAFCADVRGVMFVRL